MKEIEEFCPKDKKEWRAWLERNHIEKDAIWLILYRNTSSKYNLSWSDSVDESLCFGWIDSTKKTIDSERYKQYFTKRKAKSNWSRINKEKVQNLIEKRLMTKAGFQSIEVAKENGSWTILDEIEQLIVPNDLYESLSSNKNAFEYFDGQSKSIKKILLYWVASAKRQETRQKRIVEIVENARQCMKPKPFR